MLPKIHETIKRGKCKNIIYNIVIKQIDEPRIHINTGKLLYKVRDSKIFLKLISMQHRIQRREAYLFRSSLHN